MDIKYVGGMKQISAEMGTMPSAWTIYFTTDNLKDSSNIAVPW
jgi:hypothetical protein